jgi:ABC-type multidrug transport system fused ATPase/permease subunit
MTSKNNTKLKTRVSIERTLKLLQKKDRSKLIFLVAIQITLNLLDVIGIALIGLIAALSVNGVASKTPGTRIEKALRFAGIANLHLQSQVAILAICTTMILIIKTAASVFFTKRSLYFLSAKASSVSVKLLSKILSQDLIQMQRWTSQNVVYVISSGINSMVLGILGATISVIADLSLLIVISIFLFLVSPSVAMVSLIFFGIVGFFLYKSTHLRASKVGQEDAALTVKENDKILEVLSAYREAIVRNRRAYYISEIGSVNSLHAAVYAERTFMPNISKYVIEVSVVLGSILIGAVQFLLLDASHAIGTLSIFLAAGSRVAPASLRIQQSLLQLKTSMGAGSTSFELLDALKEIKTGELSHPVFNSTHIDFDPRIEIRNVSYTYPENPTFGIENLNLDIKKGQNIAIVGSSGAGKTTLADLILGVLEPQTGEILISGKNPRKAIELWPGAISYVPQDVLVVNGTIRENICLGYATSEVPDKEALAAASNATLLDFISSLPDGLETKVGDRGSKLSGGQRQRLGIARALITSPELIIFDEATSSLDGETEFKITDALKRIKGKCTVLIIAHRLSSVRDADLVIYLDRGKILAAGSFSDVRKQVPDFDRQAELMGL